MSCHYDCAAVGTRGHGRADGAVGWFTVQVEGGTGLD